MITATELRIGNWVNNGEGLFFTIDTSSFMDILYAAQLNNGNTLLIPIPLTSEIFEKCGFNVTSKGFYQHPNWCNVSLKYLRGTYNLRCNFMDIIANNIDYLHQLQNLFYSLTGEELNFLPD